MELLLDRITSPLGDLLLVTDHSALCALEFASFEGRLLQYLRKHYEGFALVTQTAKTTVYRQCVEAYFAGELHSLASIPVRLCGTDFQKQVWQRLGDIRAGQTWSYAALAAQLNAPKAVRAVGMANSRNPVAIVVPCHRVIGSDGALTGYAGGIDRKRWLLQHEGVELEPTPLQLGLIWN
ncbi:MAG TPA: methylated-DNA--[protein]-cysteine S-methyltransferase [Stenomitos sp.]